MQTEIISMPSSDGITTLNGYLWTPDPGTPVKAVFQFVHGMLEHMGRYAVFAEFFTSQGFAVIGHDHLGHGKSIIDRKHRGFFAEKDGYEKLIADMYAFTKEGKKRFPGLPNFILGHSMGSFMLRLYLTRYSDEVCGAVILGTGRHSVPELDIGIALTGMVKLLRGQYHKTFLMAYIIMGRYNSRFKAEHSRYAWLTSDPEVQRSYPADPLCGKLFTTSAWLDFLKVVRLLAKHEGFENIRRDLPLFFVSGSEDPVGGGKAVPKVRDEYVRLGFTDVSLLISPGGRHELLRDPAGRETMQTIADWIVARMNMNK